jgi:hypothetical protein
MLQADSASEVANNAFLKLCRLDVSQETERWARTPPKFALDGRVAVVTVDSGFQGTTTISLALLMPSASCHRHALGWKSRSEEQEVNHGYGK